MAVRYFFPMANGEKDDHPARRFGWSDMFVPEDLDERLDGDVENSERGVLVGSLSDRRLTFVMKCADLDAEQMAQRSVAPSDLSLLGLVRHLADVERYWFREVLAGTDVPPHFSENDPNGDFNGAHPDPALVEESWRIWRAEVTFADALVANATDLGMLGAGKPTPLREVLVHMIEEYARHNGHADFLRERIDGRVGQ